MICKTPLYDLIKKYKSILSQYYCCHLTAVKVPLFVIPINVDQFQFLFKLSQIKIPSKLTLSSAIMELKLIL